jgi:ubiquinone/menaquinone biosynthesis C-methylase UbiE
MSDVDKNFHDSIAKVYDALLVPLIFEPYAADLARRLTGASVSSVLEVAAGTGVVTRALASALPDTTTIVATDLNQAMLDQARVVGTSRAVEWRQADAMQLPFGDETFDAVVCQFGVMFFPDKPKGFSEARRVLRSGGVFIFSVWDRIEENEFADTVTKAVAAFFPQDPPRFLARTPHGYHDRDAIRRDVRAGGFAVVPEIETVAAQSRAASPDIPAVGYCQGTPLRNEIEARAPEKLAEATAAATRAVAARFGSGGVDGKISALVVAVKK